MSSYNHPFALLWLLKLLCDVLQLEELALQFIADHHFEHMRVLDGIQALTERLKTKEEDRDKL